MRRQCRNVGGRNHHIAHSVHIHRADLRDGFATHIIHRNHRARRRRIGCADVQADEFRHHIQNAAAGQLLPQAPSEGGRPQICQRNTVSASAVVAAVKIKIALGRPRRSVRPNPHNLPIAQVLAARECGVIIVIARRINEGNRDAQPQIIGDAGGLRQRIDRVDLGLVDSRHSHTAEARRNRIWQSGKRCGGAVDQRLRRARYLVQRQHCAHDAARRAAQIAGLAGGIVRGVRGDDRKVFRRNQNGPVRVNVGARDAGDGVYRVLAGKGRRHGRVADQRIDCVEQHVGRPPAHRVERHR